MKIKLKGVTVDIRRNDLDELIKLQHIISHEIKTNKRKVRGQLLELSLDLVNNRIADISYDLAYANEIHTIV
tara:strand:+ start:1577 stop:1792 length:216 start_codon:yes stop_codon:yes gene_type:complete